MTAHKDIFHLRLWLAIGLMFICMMTSTDAFASATAPTIGANPLVEASAYFAPAGSNGSGFACSDYQDTLFTKVVFCLERTIIRTTLYFMQEFIPEMEPVVYALLTLAIIVYGVAMATGSIERVARDTMMMLFKFAGVVYFIEFGNDVYWEFVGILMGTLNELSNMSSWGSQLACPTPSFNDVDPVFGYYSTVNMWQRVDCIFDLMIGISSETAIDTNGGRGDNGLQSMSRGMMAYFFYNLQSGALGILIGMVGLYIAFNLMLALMRASFTYLTALSTLSFLFIIGIIFVPLIMFTNTFEYYKRWGKMLIAMIIQPLILFAYLNVLIVAFDILLFSGSNSLMRTICGAGAPIETSINSCSGNISTDPNEIVISNVDENRQYKLDYKAFSYDLDQESFDMDTPEASEGTAGNVEYLDPDDDGRAGETVFDPQIYQNPPPGQTPDWSEVPVDLRYVSVKYDDITGGAAGLAGSVMLVGLCSYILLTFMAEIPMLATDLGGGINETPNIIAGSGTSLPMSQQISGAAGSVRSSVGSKVSSLVGLR